MNDRKLTDHFYLWEFIPPDIYNSRTEFVCMGLIDERIPKIVEFIRKRFDKPTYINTWKYSKLQRPTYIHSGFRDSICNFGAKLSQHRFGRAADLKIPGISSIEIRKDIESSFDLYKQFGLTTIEKDTDGWVHIDCRPTGLDHLLQFKKPTVKKEQ